MDILTALDDVHIIWSHVTNNKAETWWGYFSIVSILHWMPSNKYWDVINVMLQVASTGVEIYYISTVYIGFRLYFVSSCLSLSLALSLVLSVCVSLSSLVVILLVSFAFFEMADSWNFNYSVNELYSRMRCCLGKIVYFHSSIVYICSIFSLAM